MNVNDRVLVRWRDDWFVGSVLELSKRRALVEIEMNDDDGEKRTRQIWIPLHLINVLSGRS